MRTFIFWILSVVFFTLTGLSPQQALSAAIAEENPSATSSEPAKADTPEKKGITLFGEMSLKEHRVFVNPGGEDELRFVPNAPLIITAGLEIFSNEIVFRFPLKSEDPQGRDQGNTDYFSVQSTQRISSAEFRVYYERYRGFYVNNVLTPTGDFFIFPNMESRRRGAEAVYYIGYPPRDELFSRFEEGSDHRFVKWGGSVGLLYDDTALHNIPQDSVFPGGTGSPFSDADMTTIAPRIGVQFMILSDLEGKMTRPAFLYWDTSFSLGYGDTRLASIDRGQPRSERLNTTELSFTLDMGIRQRDAFAGMKVSNDSIVLDKGGGFEFDSFSLGFYAGVSF
jgi:hypothetical protein